MRQVELQVLYDESRNYILSVIPSSYLLCRMYDHNVVEVKITSDNSSERYVDLSKFAIYLHFISGNRDLGEVLVNPENDEYKYSISRMYTMESKLQVQLVLKTDDSDERTNIVTFKLDNSHKQPKQFDQNLSYLERLIMTKRVVLDIDEEMEELVLYDDLENELCRIDIADFIELKKPNEGGDDIED